MSSETQLEEIFNNSVALLERGEDPQIAFTSPAEAVELGPMVGLLQESKSWPRYRLSTATRTTLSASLTAQLLAMPPVVAQPQAAPMSQPSPVSLPRPRLRLGWHLFGSAKGLAAALALVLVITVVLLAAFIPSSRIVKAGILEQVGADFIVVSGQRIQTDQNTVFKLNDLKLGQPVAVEVIRNKDDQLLAVVVLPPGANQAANLPVQSPTPNQSPQPPPSPVPTVTPAPSATATPEVTITPAPTATATPGVTQSPTAAPIPTATPAPPSGPVEVEGVVQNVAVNNNVTVVVINNVQYILPPDYVKQLGPSLKIGIVLKLKGNRQGDGTIIVVNVTVVNNKANPAPPNGDNKANNDNSDNKGKKQKDSPDDHDNGKGNDNKNNGNGNGNGNGNKGKGK